MNSHYIRDEDTMPVHPQIERQQKLALWAVVVLLITFGLLCIGKAIAADYTRDGGTADWMCCADKACTTIISQHADPVRAEKACGKLTDADGVTRYTRSHAFRITRIVVTQPGQALLQWTPPTQNTDGSALTNLAGYRIHYGLSPTVLTQAIQVSNPSATSHRVEGLSPGTYYFAMTAYTENNQSALSNVASKVVP